MTTTEKEAFFAQYINQEVYQAEIFDDTPPVKLTRQFLGDTERRYLSLRSLDSITDEEAIELGKILLQDEFNGSIRRGELGEIVLYGKKTENVFIWDDSEILYDETDDSLLAIQAVQSPLLKLQAYDYLRSKSFLVPFRNFSTSDIIESGAAKIRTV